MSALKINYVSALPGALVANSIYMVSASASELQIVAVGKTASDVRKTTLISETATQITTALAAMRLADSTGLSTDVDGKISTAIGLIGLASSATLSSDVANAINTEIAKLDQSNTAVYAATIAARDALVLTKNSFVFVQDATGDATVTLGAAMYFYNKTASTYTKIAEYEGMDVTFPNRAIVEKLSIIDGQLAYDGAIVGTVQAGSTEW